MKLEPVSELGSPFTPDVRQPSANGRAADAEVPVPLTPVRDGENGGMTSDYEVTIDPPDPARVHVEGEDVRTGEENFGHFTFDVIKGLDVGFGIELKALEDEARRYAAEWAEKGLPRHDLEPEEPLEVEQVLTKRCVQVFSEWVRKVRTRMEDTIEREAQALGKKVVALRQFVDQVSDTRDQLIATLTERKRTNQPAPAPRGLWRLFFPSEMSGRFFWPLMILLVSADFFANVPVFMELLPANAAADAKLQEWEEDASGNLWLFPLRVVARMAVYPEATILALSVIVFLVFLAHVVGTASRTLFALWGTRKDANSAEVNEVRTRPWAPFALSVVGIVITLGVLYVSRNEIRSAAEHRYAVAQERLTSIEREIEDARSKANVAVVAEKTKEREVALGEVQERRRRFDYTQSIGAMNLPVLGLNLVLVIAAIVAGYQRHNSNVTIGEEPPKAVPAPVDNRAERISALRASLRQQREGAMLLASDIETVAGKVYHLLRARPLLEWGGKANRLEAIVPMFRAENARLRAMDTRSIRAFSTPARLELPEIDPTAPFAEPPALRRHVEEYATLKLQLAELTPPSILEEDAA